MEKTSQIANIAYDIENWIYDGISLNEIIDIINEMKVNNKFPQNLELIDAYLGKTGTSGCAFLDTNTGEVIVGFAGTNVKPGFSEGAKDIVADIIIGLQGFTLNHKYLAEANEFMKGLENYNVTQVTGHSLGGAISVLVGANNNIQTIVTYNGAPIHVSFVTRLLMPAAKILAYKQQEITIKCMANYNGKIIRFVSSKDQLNNVVDLFDGYYAGDKIIFLNGKTHDMKFFLEDTEQKLIQEIIELETGTWKGVEDLSVDFDGDGKVDISLDIAKIPVKNLLKSSGNYFKGDNIKISPDELKNLAKNLKAMVNDDISWIKNAINKCIEKNNTIKANKYKREDRLYDEILEELKNARLTQLLYSIDDSHGELTSKYNLEIIESFSYMDIYSVTRKFDRWGESIGRIWYLDGNKYNISKINNLIKKLNNTSSFLKNVLTSTGETTCYTYYTNGATTFKFDTMSKIGDDFVKVTNGFISKAKGAFEGTGLTSDKKDGIVNAFEEVLSVELKNIEEIGHIISNIADMAEAISINFENVDKEISNFIESGSSSKYLQAGNIPACYDAYLEENHILDDVNDIIEAFNIQVEEASERLARDVLLSYEPLIDRTYRIFKNIIESLEEFNDVIYNLDKKLYSNIKSEKWEIDNSNSLIASLIPKKVEYNHGTLASNLPSGISYNISYANENIKPILENFYQSITISKIFQKNIDITRGYFKRIIETAVYTSMDLSTITKTQRMIAIIIQRMKIEIKKVSNQLLENYEGKTFENYSEQLNKAIKLLEYFEIMLDDCYGVN